MPTPSDPTAAPSKQFSSDKNGDPMALLNATKECVNDHASIVEAYGLCQPVATLGSHAWLRDSLATQGEEEPGNALPQPGMKVPQDKDV